MRRRHASGGDTKTVDQKADTLNPAPMEEKKKFASRYKTPNTRNLRECPDEERLQEPSRRKAYCPEPMEAVRLAAALAAEAEKNSAGPAAATEQLDELMRDLKGFAISEDDGGNEEIKAFWQDVRSKLWIDEDELDDPPYMVAMRAQLRRSPDGQDDDEESVYSTDGNEPTSSNEFPFGPDPIMEHLSELQAQQAQQAHVTSAPSSHRATAPNPMPVNPTRTRTTERLNVHCYQHLYGNMADTHPSSSRVGNVRANDGLRVSSTEHDEGIEKPSNKENRITRWPTVYQFSSQRSPSSSPTASTQSLLLPRDAPPIPQKKQPLASPSRTTSSAESWRHKTFGALKQLGSSSSQSQTSTSGGGHHHHLHWRNNHNHGRRSHDSPPPSAAATPSTSPLIEQTASPPRPGNTGFTQLLPMSVVRNVREHRRNHPHRNQDNNSAAEGPRSSGPIGFPYHLPYQQHVRHLTTEEKIQERISEIDEFLGQDDDQDERK
ncbi:hypothetical protein B0H66DRAFT_548372 [Apodospora peruviana]|uniref:Uncharacterized protein n=1 Tax=Apodospora peruviana TaxID=516989 RepID=A0AAE0MAJ2_9PEZI|nr:hypothetical protein B0H66DRAFT_548372 [Apodospora peruviana]